MEQIISYNGLQLIKKYNQNYIRFTGGQYQECICDLLITNDETSLIISDNKEIINILNSHKKNIKWTKEYFIDSAIKDYIYFKCNIAKDNIEKELDKFKNHNDIKEEFYDVIMFDSFPQKNPITIRGCTAKMISEKTKKNMLEVYVYLICLRENPNEKILDL